MSWLKFCPIIEEDDWWRRKLKKWYILVFYVYYSDDVKEIYWYWWWLIFIRDIEGYYWREITNDEEKLFSIRLLQWYEENIILVLYWYIIIINWRDSNDWNILVIYDDEIKWCKYDYYDDIRRNIMKKATYDVEEIQ